MKTPLAAFYVAALTSASEPVTPGTTYLVPPQPYQITSLQAGRDHQTDRYVETWQTSHGGVQLTLRLDMAGPDEIFPEMVDGEEFDHLLAEFPIYRDGTDKAGMEIAGPFQTRQFRHGEQACLAGMRTFEAEGQESINRLRAFVCQFEDPVQALTLLHSIEFRSDASP